MKTHFQKKISFFFFFLVRLSLNKKRMKVDNQTNFLVLDKVFLQAAVMTDIFKSLLNASVDNSANTWIYFLSLLTYTYVI